ncbi:MAG: AAA-like domain-containing protein [Lachnospiraceae bacterium]|nr:AAA-like domain-containing protein [Lachnospiraceae bacterium]
MPKIFNVAAVCLPDVHYMVDITERLRAIREMVDRGDYFTINRARQYGKTTTMYALKDFLKTDYIVVYLDFQLLAEEDYASEASFVRAFCKELLFVCEEMEFPVNVKEQLQGMAGKETTAVRMADMFVILSGWCRQAAKPIVLMIDEVDTASNNQVFLDFLSQLRGNYIRRREKPTFQSVILAGVYDIKNLKRKFVKEGQHSTNSPWNVAADFLVDMSFSPRDIAGMLAEYESDYQTGMDINAVAEQIYEYTSGYPFLVSRICKLIDEQIAGTERFADRACAWTTEGVTAAVGRILNEKNTLFESLQDKIDTYPELRQMLYSLLMNGKSISYSPDDAVVDIALMFGFVRVENFKVVVANRIFETRLYNAFLTSPEMMKSEMYILGDREKPQFIKNGKLDMKLILERFVISFDELYGDRPQSFLEEDGRRYFLLYLRPIINGTGNYYIESRTRNQERTDVIVDYNGQQYVVELKIWRGNAYNERGEKQLIDYLEYYHLNKGYMLSFNFNKKKEIGIREVSLGEKLLIEAVV